MDENGGDHRSVFVKRHPRWTPPLYATQMHRSATEMLPSVEEWGENVARMVLAAPCCGELVCC